MTALNCVMLSAHGQPVPLPGEKFLYSSKPTTISISLFSRPPGADFSVQPKKGQEYKHNNGTLHVSQKRIVYVAADAASSLPMSGAAAAGGASSSILGSLAAGQASLAPYAMPAPTPDKVQLATLSIPLRVFIDGHLVQPWFGANYYEALCIEGDGSGDLQGPHIVRLYFKEGGGYEFYTAVEEVKARAESQNSRRDTPVGEQLPAYSASGTTSLAAPSAIHSSSSPFSSSNLAPPPPPSGSIPPRTAPSPADLAAAETARAAEEAERVQREREEMEAAAGAAGAGTVPPLREGEAPPGYSV
ncbi:hypothetical protein JCM10908_002759 [Rhodotorula pacifica]|uniref:uncharacterized protein n=1 Tax=Rhodotorula pacifica TaxID=1495444 RepID=UPI00317F14FD